MSYCAWCGRVSTGQFWRVQAVGDVVVTQNKNEPASLKATFIRDEMTVENGDAIAIQTNEEGDSNLFYGYVETTNKHDNKVEVTAYDQLHRLTKNTDIKNYGVIKASDLFIQICDANHIYMLEPPVVADTGYPIPGVIADGTNDFDLIIEALNVTYSATGTQYVVWDAFKNARIMSLEEQRLDPVTFQVIYDNTADMSYTEDISDLANEVVVTSNDQEAIKQLAVLRNQPDVDRYFKRTYSHKIQDGENADVVAQTLLQEKDQIKRSLKVTVFGDNVQVYPGRIVQVDFYHTSTGIIAENIMGDFVIESVTHTLSKGGAKMDIDLSVYKMGEF